MTVEELKDYIAKKIDEDYYSMTWADFIEDPKIKAEYQDKKRRAIKLIEKMGSYL